MTSRTKIILDVGANHNRDFDLAKKYVDLCASFGVDTIKFQTYSAETLYSRNTPDFAGYSDVYNLIKSIALPREWQRDLKQYCDEKKVEFISTPFDIAAVDELVEIGVKRMKIASFEATDKYFVKYVAKTNLPIIVSTGLCSLDEITKLYDWIREETKSKITFLHCMSKYPVFPDDINLGAMVEIFQTVFNHILQICGKNKPDTNIGIGLSDHTPGIIVPLLCKVVYNPEIIEKHFSLSRKMDGPDHGDHALEPDEISEMMRYLKLLNGTIPKICQNKSTYPFHEDGSRNLKVEGDMIKARRSIVALRKIKLGETFSIENLTTKRPGTGIPACDMDNVVGKNASRNIEEDEILTYGDIK